MFGFTREEFGSYLEEVKTRIIQADEYLNTGKELELINEYYKK
jgi:predicted HTH domain antitoxin